LPGFDHSGLGGSIGSADPATGSSFGFVDNRLVTPKLFDQARHTAQFNRWRPDVVEETRSAARGQMDFEERCGCGHGAVDVLGHVVEIHVGTALDNHQLLFAAHPRVQSGAGP
jgi:hypothetical protein